jgi:hypothetical protein
MVEWSWDFFHGISLVEMDIQTTTISMAMEYVQELPWSCLLQPILSDGCTDCVRVGKTRLELKLSGEFIASVATPSTSKGRSKTKVLPSQLDVATKCHG